MGKAPAYEFFCHICFFLNTVQRIPAILVQIEFLPGKNPQHKQLVTYSIVRFHFFLDNKADEMEAEEWARKAVIYTVCMEVNGREKNSCVTAKV